MDRVGVNEMDEGGQQIRRKLQEEFFEDIAGSGYKIGNNSFTRRGGGIRPTEMARGVLNTLKYGRVAGTSSGHTTAVRGWCTFCQQYKLDAMRPVDDVLMMYLQWKVEMGNAAVSLAKEVGKLRVKLADIGVAVPTNRDLPLVKRFLVARKKLDEGTRKKKKRCPIMTPCLRDLVEEVRKDPTMTGAEKTLYSAVYSCMFFFFLRISEVVPGGSGKTKNPAIKLADISFKVDRVTGKRIMSAKLPPGKTDKSGEKFTMVVSELDEKDSKICPVRLLLELVRLEGRNAPMEEDLFSAPTCGYPKLRLTSKAVK